MSYKIGIPCTICGKDHKKTVPNKSSAVQAYKEGKPALCSKECRKEHYAKISIREERSCKRCKNTYLVRPKLSRYFCSKKCYREDCKEFPEKYGLLNKAENMRRKTDKVSATKKMLATKVERGLAVDWKDSEWKSWWKKCNAILLKKRKVLVADWDGYDYIDGKYIKDNLKLDYRHRDYPTLDHVIPKQKLYLEGLSPYEASSDDNLKWTTRSNNSKKGNKERKLCNIQ